MNAIMIIFCKFAAGKMKSMAMLINEYSRELHVEYEELVSRSTACLPYTVSHPLEQFYLTVEQGNYAKAKDYLLELFELGAQYLSVVLLATLRQKDCADAVAPVVRKIDQKRPLSFGDWCNDILPPLTAVLIKQMPDSPLAAALARRTSPRFNLFIGGKNETSIVFYRNQYKGHGTMLSDDKYRELLVALEPRLMQMLQAMAPLCDCTVLWQEGHYWLESDSGKVDMAPLVTVDGRGYEYIFQSLNDEKAYFVSANELAESRLDTTDNPAIDAFFQAFVPAFDIAKRRNWTEWTALLRAETGRWLQGVYREKKYNRELFVDRVGLSSQLREFISSDATLFPLPGEAGQGKTNQLCYWSESLEETTLILSGSDLSGMTLEAYLRRVLEVSGRKPVSKALDELHAAASEADAQLVVLIDALNECENYGGQEEFHAGEQSASALLRDILCLMVEPGYPRFKVLFTCRNYTWKHHLQPLTVALPEGIVFAADDGEATTVRGFSDDELQRAYNIYSDVYSVRTPFGELGRSLAIRLKDPLVLKIACTNHLGRQMPTATRELTSLTLWAQLHDGLRDAYAGSRQLEILDLMSESVLRSYLDGHPSNSLRTADLRQAADETQNPLHTLAELIFGRQGSESEGGISVAFAELVNRPERPILRYDADDRVQFVYERFLEYMLALQLRRSVLADLSAGSVLALMGRVSPDEVMLGAFRNVLIMNYAESGDSSLLLELIATHSDDFLLMTLLTDVMNVLVRENYEREVFAIERDLITRQTPADIASIYPEFNSLQRSIETNKATGNTIDRFNALHVRLQPVLHLRTMAIQTLLGGLMLTDYFNESLYSEDPFELLWMLTGDPLVEVKDAVCLQSYYISHQHFTLGGTPIYRNLSELIAQRMYQWLTARPVLFMALRGSSRRRMMTFLETATRLMVILIIDAMLSQQPEQEKRIGPMLDQIRAVIRHLTLGGGLIRLALPVLGTVMRRQLTFQSDYVNNAIEYQHYWEAIPHRGGAGEWCREDVPEAMQFIYQYSSYYSQGRGSEAPDFSTCANRIYDAYSTGDSLSYFVIERLLVINGVCNWQSVWPLLARLDGGELRSTQWWDYSQMSIIYVLYQLGMKMDRLPDEAYDMLGRWCVDWTRRLRGSFVAPNSSKANARQKYKRNVMTWYAMVSAHRGNDDMPLFYRLIDEAVDSADGELMTHLVDNISELVSDSGYVQPALALLTHVMRRVDSIELMQRMGVEDTLPQQIALMLSTAKSYAPQAVNTFLTAEAPQLPFPGVANYRDEILNYTPCGEKLSDLMTHRFGNFVIFALINNREIDRFCYDAAAHLPRTDDFSDWLAIVVRMLVRDLFKINVKV